MSATSVSPMAAFYALCAVPIAVILFVMIRRTVRQIPQFGDHATVISVCVTLLCMIGLYRTFVDPTRDEPVPTPDRRPWLEFVLLAYTVLALAMLLAFLLRFGLRWKDRFGGHDRRIESTRHQDRTDASIQSPPQELSKWRPDRLPGSGARLGSGRGGLRGFKHRQLRARDEENSR